MTATATAGCCSRGLLCRGLGVAANEDRSECLDWPLILNRRHLQHVLRVFADHYNARTGRTAR